MYEWDEAKRRKNLLRHGVDFSAIESFQWEEVRVLEDTRKNYGERRFRGFGPINGRMHCVAFTVRCGNIRLISLGKANARDVTPHG